MQNDEWVDALGDSDTYSYTALVEPPGAVSSVPAILANPADYTGCEDVSEGENGVETRVAKHATIL